MTPNTSQLSDFLTARAADIDRTGDWPGEQWRRLADGGVLRVAIPPEYSGRDAPAGELEELYIQLAERCLTTTFILTQFNAACARLALCENAELKQHLLPGLATGELFATIGISHLTTSRQHIQTPAVRVAIDRNEITLNGAVPWVTGAAHAHVIVTGGTCDSGEQVLVALPADAAGVSIEPHAQLMALTGSHTASVKLNDVRIPSARLLAGPVPEVMKRFGGGAGGLTTSALAVGLASRSVKLIAQQAAMRPDLCGTSDQFQTELDELRADLLRAATTDLPTDTDMRLNSAALRQRANSLAARVTQAAMAISKGAGFVKGHPAELAVREAMFFLVWSCPQPVVQGVLEELTCREGL